MPYFATEDNCKIYYEESGEGEAVVFVHGWDCNRHFFKKQIPEFAKNYHVLAYEAMAIQTAWRKDYIWPSLPRT